VPAQKDSVSRQGREESWEREPSSIGRKPGRT
jgi:hypothetical protein